MGWCIGYCDGWNCVCGTDRLKVLEIEADIFQNLSYTEEQFRTEALTVKGEYLKNNASPIRKLLSAFLVNANAQIVEFPDVNNNVAYASVASLGFNPAAP